MDHIEIYHIDAFTDKVFHGNPAAVCLISYWLNDELLQAIALENNRSETAFIIQRDDIYHIRWFTPKGEITLSGHATLAAAFVLFELYPENVEHLQFSSLSGPLYIQRKGDLITMDFPRLDFTAFSDPNIFMHLINQPILEAYQSELDYLFLLKHERHVAQATIDLKILANLPGRGLIITAQADDVDFYSRCFYPKHHIPEDPVTGSAHCVLAPFWAERLHTRKLHARQGALRQGELYCDVLPQRVLITGQCRWFSKGYLVI